MEALQVSGGHIDGGAGGQGLPAPLSSHVASKYLLVVLSFSFLLSYSVVFQIYAKPSHPQWRLFQLNSHLFFAVFAGITSVLTSVSPWLGGSLLCIPIGTFPANLFCITEVLYLVQAAFLLASARGRYGWLVRLYQVAAILVLLDFKVQTRKHCPLERPTVLTCAMPFVVGAMLYGVCAGMEVAVIRSEEFVGGGGEGKIGERDKILGELLFDYFKTEETRRTKAQ